MKAYRTYLTVTDPKQIVISDAPFHIGERVEIVLMTAEDNSQKEICKLKSLFTETQSLAQTQTLSEDDILREIEAYRNGK